MALDSTQIVRYHFPKRLATVFDCKTTAPPTEYELFLAVDEVTARHSLYGGDYGYLHCRFMPLFKKFLIFYLKKMFASIQFTALCNCCLAPRSNIIETQWAKLFHPNKQCCHFYFNKFIFVNLIILHRAQMGIKDFYKIESPVDLKKCTPLLI